MAIRDFLIHASLIGMLGGCSVTGPAEFAVPAGEYAGAFSASREVLRECRFDLERIDAGEGVLSTLPKHSSGIFTPWDTEQSSIAAELDDSVNHQSRRVRIVFDPSDAPHDAARTGRVEVVVYRLQDYSLRPSTRAIQFSTRAVDPLNSARGVYPQYEVPTTQDPAFASRLARAIEVRMAKCGAIQRAAELTPSELSPPPAAGDETVNP
jgi:hypothetical protein